MHRRKLSFIPFLFWILLSSAGTRTAAGDMATDQLAVARVIDQSIGWFQTKDFDLLFRVFSDSPRLFLFQPTSSTTIVGGEAFRKFSAVWKNPDLVYERHEIRDLRIDLSPKGDTAWFSAILDDCSRYRGKAGCWKDARWTGVLLKQEGHWTIVQMHFSFAEDKIREEERAKQQRTDR